MVIMKSWKNDPRSYIIAGLCAFGIYFYCALLVVCLVVGFPIFADNVITDANAFYENRSEHMEHYKNDVNPDLRKGVPFGYIEGNGGSMEPTLCSGSQVWYIDKEIQKGDIVVFDSGTNGIVIHRTVRKTENGWLTKGDNNNYIDQKVDLGNNYANKSTTIGIVTSYKSNCNN